MRGLAAYEPVVRIELIAAVFIRQPEPKCGEIIEWKIIVGFAVGCGTGDSVFGVCSHFRNAVFSSGFPICDVSDRL